MHFTIYQDSPERGHPTVGERSWTLVLAKSYANALISGTGQRASITLRKWYYLETRLDRVIEGLRNNAARTHTHTHNKSR